MPLFVPTDGSMSRSSGRNTTRRFLSRTSDAVDVDIIVSAMFPETGIRIVFKQDGIHPLRMLPAGQRGRRPVIGCT